MATSSILFNFSAERTDHLLRDRPCYIQFCLCCLLAIFFNDAGSCSLGASVTPGLLSFLSGAQLFIMFFPSESTLDVAKN